MSAGRYVKKGMTWKSTAITIAVILIAMLALGLLFERTRKGFDLDARVIDHRVIDSDGICAWQLEIEAHNISDRELHLRSARLDGLDDSERAIVGAVAPSMAIVRTFRYPLPDCSTDPEALGAGRLVLHFRPRASTADRSVVVDID